LRYVILFYIFILTSGFFRDYWRVNVVVRKENSFS